MSTSDRRVSIAPLWLMLPILPVGLMMPACGKAPRSAGQDVGGELTSDTGVRPADSSSGSGGDDASDGAEASGDATQGGTRLDVGPGTPPGVEFPTTCEQAELAQTSVGCEFYPLALPQRWKDPFVAGARDPAVFAAGNVSERMATVTLSNVAGVVATQTVAPGEVGLFQVGVEHALDAESDATQQGFVLTSNEPLQVYQFVPAEPYPTADASIVLPKSSLGERHRLVSYNDGTAAGGQYVAVVGTEDDTAVTITLPPGGHAQAGDGVPAFDDEAGSGSQTLVVNRFDTLVVGVPDEHPTRGTIDNELTGALVESDKPVAVYSGTSPAYVPRQPPVTMACCVDLMASAVPPTTVFGRQYVGAKMLTIGTAPDLWRFVADHDGTTIELTGGVTQTLTLDAGEFADVSSLEPFVANADQPFVMTQFMTSFQSTGFDNSHMFDTHDCGQMTRLSDPAFEWVYPVENWLGRYLFPVGPESGQAIEWCHDHGTVVATLAQWDMVQFDGLPLPDPTPIGSSDFGYVHIPLGKTWYEVEAPPGAKVQLSVYGYTGHGSYMYPGGMGLRTFNPQG